ncbi:MAG: substrate-binding domain-containing protein [Betaproteobacteria bacterium]|nr:substrate-binding domain-containing protein [Betaproteobacteria bacterium]
MKRSWVALAAGLTAFAGLAFGQGNEIKIAHIYGKTGPLEAYGKQSHIGFMLGLEYATHGMMKVLGRKIVVIEKDTQNKPEVGKADLEAAYGDDKVDLAVGPVNSGVALAMLPVAQEYKKILLVEPAVADSITGDKWNRYIFRTARNSTQDAVAAAAATPKGKVSIAMLAQDYAFGHDGVKAFKEALAKLRPEAKIVHEEYAPPATTDFTAPAERIFQALKDQPGRKIFGIIWAGPSPLAKIEALKPERYGIQMAPGGNILPVMQSWRDFAGIEGAIYYYYGFPKNKANDWLVKEHEKRYGQPPDFFTCGGMAAAIAVVDGIKKAGSTDTDKLIHAMEGMSFDTCKGKMTFRKEDHQAMQDMYEFRIKPRKDQKNDWDLLDLVRTIPASEMPIPIQAKQ